MTTQCDANFCKGGCCRVFFDTVFCDVQSNCVAAPTWIIALVPAMLGIAALFLVIWVIVRLKNRQVNIAPPTKMQIALSEARKLNPQGPESDRNMNSDRPLHSIRQ